MADQSELSIRSSDVAVLSDRKECWSELGVHVYIRIGIVAALLYFLFRVEIDSVVSRWISDSSWSHGFLIPLFGLYFLNQRKDEILNLEITPSYTGLFLLLFSIAFYVFNIISPAGYGYFRSTSVIMALGSVVFLLGGYGLIKHAWLPVAYLIFAVPLPDRYYKLITIPMRQLAAIIASALLSMVKDLEAVANGVVIDVVYKGQRLEPGLDVAEACSGMRLLMAFMALGVAMAYLHYRPTWQRIILLVSTVPIAILCNIIRVTVTGFIYILGDPQYAQGIYHDMLGMAMLPLAFGLYGFLAWFMENLFAEEATASQAKDVIIRSSSSESRADTDKLAEGGEN